MFKKVLCILVALLMIVAMVPAAALAEEGQPSTEPEPIVTVQETQEPEPPAPTEAPTAAPTPTDEPTAVPEVSDEPAPTDVQPSNVPGGEGEATETPLPSETPSVEPSQTPEAVISPEAQAVIDAIDALPETIAWSDFDTVEQTGLLYMALPDPAQVTNAARLMDAAAQLYALYAAAVATLPEIQNYAVDPVILSMRAQIEASTFILSVAPSELMTLTDRVDIALQDFITAAEESEASINGVYYETLTLALAAVQKNQVVVINKDFTTTTSYTAGITNAAFTVDLNGKTITANLPASGAGSILFDILRGTVTFANGTVTLTTGQCIIRANSGAEVVVVSGTYTAASGVAVTASTGTATLTGGTFTSNGVLGTVASLGGTLYVKGGTINATNSNGACMYVGYTSSAIGGAAVVSGGTFNAPSYGLYVFKHATLLINGGTINIAGPGQAICGNGTEYGSIDVTINNVAVNVTSAGDKTGCGIYAPSFSTLTINGGTFNVDGNCVELKAGTARINGGTFHAKGTSASPDYANGNGNSGSGNCIDIIGNNSYAASPDIDLTIKGGSFTSDFYSALRMANVSGSTKTLTATVSGGSFTAGTVVFENLEGPDSLTMNKASANIALLPSMFTLGTTSYLSGDYKRVYSSFADMLKAMSISDPFAVTGNDRITANSAETFTFAFVDMLESFAAVNDLTIDVSLENETGNPPFVLSNVTSGSAIVTAPDTTDHVTATLIFAVSGLKGSETNERRIPITVIPSIAEATEISAINLLSASVTTDLNYTDTSMTVPIVYIINGVDLDSLDDTRFDITDVQVKNPKTGLVMPELTARFEHNAVLLDVDASVVKATKLSAVLVFSYTYEGTDKEPVVSRTLAVKITKSAPKFTIKQLTKIDVYRNDVSAVPDFYTYGSVPLSVSANIESIEAQDTDPEFTIAKDGDNIFYLYAKTASKLTTADKRTPMFTVKFNNGYDDVTDYKLPIALTSIKPALKLSPTSTTALRDVGKTATVKLISSSTKIVFDLLNVDTANITTDMPDVFDISFADNTLTLTNLVALTADSYKLKVLVPFTDSTEVLALPLTLSCKSPLSIKPAASSATINLLSETRSITVPLKVAPATELAELESVSGIAADPVTGDVVIGPLTFSVANNQLTITAADGAIPVKSTPYVLKFVNCTSTSKLSVTVVQKNNTATLSPSSVKLNKTVADYVTTKFIMKDGRLVGSDDITLTGVGFLLESVAKWSVEDGMIRLESLSTATKGTYKIQIVDKHDGHLSITKMPVLTLTIVDTAVSVNVRTVGTLDTLNVNKPVQAFISLSGTTSVLLKSLLSTLTTADLELVGDGSAADLPVHIVADSYDPAKGSFLIAWNDVDAIVANNGQQIKFYVKCNLAALDAVLTSKLITFKPSQGSFKITADTVALYSNAPYMAAPINFMLANGYTASMIDSISVPVSTASSHYNFLRDANGVYQVSYRGSNAWLTKSKTETVKVNVMLKGATKAITISLKISNIVP